MKSLFTLLIALTFSISSYACSCAGEDNFCSTQYGTNGYQADIIILGVKIDTFLHGMDIEIIEVLQGVESRDTIRVWGDNGALCRWYVETFAFGDTLVFALDQIGPYAFLPQEKRDDYSISACGVYFLDYSNGSVSGYIRSASTTSMPLDTFKATIITERCDTTTDTTSIFTPNGFDFELFPNPTNGMVEIQLPALTDRYSVTIYNSIGRVVARDQYLELSSKYINTSNWLKGIYIIDISDGIQSSRKKLLVY